MKRVEVTAARTPLVLRVYSKLPPTPKRGVLIKTTYAGICHSDIHLADDIVSTGANSQITFSESLTMKFPIVLGHEIAGTVHSIGEDAKKEGTKLKVGDNVVVFPWTGCDACGLCETGYSNFCKTPLNFGIEKDGGFQEYISVYRHDIVLKVPDEIPMDIASMLPCSGVTGYNAVSKIKPTVEYFMKNTGRATLLIIGAGGLGLWCLQTARACLPKNTRILIADITKEKLSNALPHGADDTVLWDTSLSDEEIVKMTQAKGADGEINAVIDFVNNSITAKRGFDCLSKGGGMAIVGLFGGSIEVPLPLCAIDLKQIFGVFVGSLHQLNDLLKLVAKDKLMPPELTYVPLEAVPATLEKLRRGEITGRALVKF